MATLTDIETRGAGDSPVSASPFNRKYRPQSFDSSELVGQDHVVRTLRNAIRKDRIAPAYLFCGPRGTGKTSTARILAKAANCLDPNPDKRPCNECVACVAINSGATPDVIEIDAASNRGIDDIRDLRERARYAPTQLKSKFYIIDEAHQITGAAANAFLKTLEEPPPQTRFILATTDPEELLPTIVSRCQRFDFRAHTVETISQRVQLLAEREGIALEAEATRLIAELAHGSMRDPIGLLDQLSNYQSQSGNAGDPITADDVRALVGMTRDEVAIDIMTAISKADLPTALRSVNEAVAAGQDPRQLNRQIVMLVRESLYLVSKAKAESHVPELAEVADRLNLQQLLRIASAFTDTDGVMRTAVIPQLPLEMAIVQSVLSLADSAQPAPRPAAERPQTVTEAAVMPQPPASEPQPSTRLQDQVRRRSETAAAKPAPRARSVSEPSGPPPEPSAPTAGDMLPSRHELSLERLIDLWQKIRADVKTLDRRTEALLSEIDPVRVDDLDVYLASPYEFHRNMLADDERRAIVESVIHRRTGYAVRIHCMLRSELTSQQPPPNGTSIGERMDAGPKEVAEAIATLPDTESEDRKLLNAVVKTFDGEIVPADD
jgi:DNA polymerase-3 subunit gamma/tau